MFRLCLHPGFFVPTMGHWALCNVKPNPILLCCEYEHNSARFYTIGKHAGHKITDVEEILTEKARSPFSTKQGCDNAGGTQKT